MLETNRRHCLRSKKLSLIAGGLSETSSTRVHLTVCVAFVHASVCGDKPDARNSVTTCDSYHSRTLAVSGFFVH